MNGSFTKGLIIGSVIGASIGMMINPETMRVKGRRKLYRMGRGLMRRSSNLVENMVHMFR